MPMLRRLGVRKPAGGVTVDGCRDLRGHERERTAMASKRLPKYTVPSLTPTEGAKVAEVLQGRLHALNDLALTLKHVHWNVVGPHFIAVHEMIDPQVVAVREMVDAIAERIATLGVAPVGTPAALVADREWEDYPLGRASTTEHLQELDKVYVGIITSHREA